MENLLFFFTGKIMSESSITCFPISNEECMYSWEGCQPSRILDRLDNKCMWQEYICAHLWDIELNTWRESSCLHFLCIYFSNPQIVIALLFGCSVAWKDCTLFSKERMDCRNKNSNWTYLDAYIQIQCHGNGQSCNATCDGATSDQDANTSKFVGVKTQSKPVWQLFPFLP